MTAQIPLLEEGRLAREIKAGELTLRGDSLVRYNFSFSVNERTIGIYAVQCLKAGSISLLRRWDQEREVTDPLTGLIHVNRGREFWRIGRDSILFLVEYGPTFDVVVDKVAFKAHTVGVYGNVEVRGANKEWRFEAVDLLEVEFCG